MLLANAGKQAMFYIVLLALAGCGTFATTSNVSTDVATEGSPAPTPILNPHWKNNCFGSFENFGFHYPVEMVKGALPPEAFGPEWDLHRDRLRTKDKEIFLKTVNKIVEMSRQFSDISNNNRDGSDLFRKIRVLRGDIEKYYDYKKNEYISFSTIFFSMKIF